MTITASGAITAVAELDDPGQQGPKQADCIAAYFRRAKIRPPGGEPYTRNVTVVPPANPCIELPTRPCPK